MKDDLRLIEAGFPCHQVGAETQRERGASSALPPLYFLHVWWARRPLTPSRAAILASLLPADTDPEWFLKQLGIKKPVVEINGIQWVLVGPVLKKITTDESGNNVIEVDARVLELLRKEDKRREKNRLIIQELIQKDPGLKRDPVIERWERESRPVPQPWPTEGDVLNVKIVAADPAWFKKLLHIGSQLNIRIPNLYGYDRAFLANPEPSSRPCIILDPTAGGGSIPFEGLRLGHKVIANELNPVATTILHATIEYPALFGEQLSVYVDKFGKRLLKKLESNLDEIFPREFKLPVFESKVLKEHLWSVPELVKYYNKEFTTTYLYCRQVTCPHCGGEAPLLNTCWLSKESGKQWGVKVITDGREHGGKVWFETYRVRDGRGSRGEDPNFATVNKGIGTCIHCRQAIEAEEIKRQARGESEHGTWKDRLYCVVAVRFQPKLGKDGKPLRYKSGPKKGEIKTEKVRFFRPPNEKDLEALELAKRRLEENWDRWDAMGIIPTEKFPQGNDMRPAIYGMTRWCDMFTPRQLLGHLTLVEGLNGLKPQILEELGEEKGRAVITYLQFAIDKCVDYNSRQTRWIAQRGQVSGSFGRHDFSLKWTFGEMIFSGPNSGFSWGLGQILDAYKGISDLIYKEGKRPDITILNGSAAYMERVSDKSVELICMDPPYYNNVQYAELSDFYYVWERRTLSDIYPDYFRRRLTNKRDEAVANPYRDGGVKEAKAAYERLMGEIFSECKRVLKDDGLLTLMFTHKSQDAWEALTRSLIKHGWKITATVPVESEFSNAQNIMNNASAISSIFISCRKRLSGSREPASWTGFGGTGVAQKIREAVREGLREFEGLDLNPVDEMVASYGRALRVLSENWPVLDGDEEVGPVRAMNEASRVVAEFQIDRITGGRLKVADLLPETAMALTLFGIYGLSSFPFDEALNLSKSLNIALETKTGGYEANGRFIGINKEVSGGRTKNARAEDRGFFAPLARKGSRLRLVRPEERDHRRLSHPQTEWDVLQGLIMAYEEGAEPVARDYLERFASGKEETVLALLEVWAKEMGDTEEGKRERALLFGLGNEIGQGA